ncbi:MAG: CBS domain-containing protein [Planctomycetes bacterium]|nr:CBS domain-containing protein [Planctomycetota bacterium]
MSLVDNLHHDTVRDLGIEPPITVAGEDPISAAIDAMRRKSKGCVLVCDPVGKLLGIFTERDILTRVLVTGKSQEDSVSSVMTASPDSTHPGDTVRDVIRRMNDGGYRHMAVVDDENHVVGVVSVRRIVNYLIEHFPMAIYNLPQSPQKGSASREGA